MRKLNSNNSHFLLLGTEILAEGTIQEISEQTGRGVHSLRSIFYATYKKDRVIKTTKKNILSLIIEEDLPIYLDRTDLDAKIEYYALYKGDELLAQGTIKEIAEQMGTSTRNIRYYRLDKYQKSNKGNGRVLVRVE